MDGIILGGVLISVSTSLNFFLFGKQTGVYQVLKNLDNPSDKNFYPALATFLGLLTVPFVTYLINGYGYMDMLLRDYYVLDSYYTMAYNIGILGWIIGGLLTGLGAGMV